MGSPSSVIRHHGVPGAVPLWGVEGSLRLVPPDEGWVGKGRGESRGSRASGNLPASLVPPWNFQAVPKLAATAHGHRPGCCYHGLHHRSGAALTGCCLLSSSSLVVCLAFGRGEQNDWGWESPRDHRLPRPGTWWCGERPSSVSTSVSSGSIAALAARGSESLGVGMR